MAVKIFSNRFLDRKLTIVASAKFFKKAVTRNLLKRRVRAILKPILKDLHSKIIVRIDAGADQLPFSEFATAIRKEVKEFSNKK